MRHDPGRPFVKVMKQSLKGVPFMKKIVSVTLLVSFVISIYFSFEQTKNDEIARFATFEREYAHPFMIPEDEKLNHAEDVYSLLQTVASHAQVNVFRGAQYFRPDERIEHIKYIMLSADTQFYNQIELVEGRMLTENETAHSDLFVTTVETMEENQVGRIRSFQANEPVTIQSLQASYDHLPVHGRYFVEVSSDQQLQHFLQELSEELNTYVTKTTEGENRRYTVADLQPKEAFIEPRDDFFLMTNASDLQTTQTVVFALTALLFIYYMFNQSKKMGILKMHGISKRRMWWLIAGKQITILAVLFAFGCVIIAVMLSFPETFIENCLVQLGIAYSVLLVLSLVCYGLISTIRVNEAIKNKKQTKAIYLLNVTVKVFLGVMIILLSLETFGNYALLQAEKRQFLSKGENVRSWPGIENYGVINAYLGYTTAYNTDEIEQDLSRSDEALAELYVPFNRQGALYVDATEFEQDFLQVNDTFEGIFSMTVNPNFLQQYPIYDDQGKAVHISEDTKDWIVLVPEQYKHEEEEIRQYYEDREMRDYYLTVDDGQRLQIIWTKQGQQIFSMNPDVFPEENNDITDPVIHVKTESNHLFTYRGGILGAGLNDPLKVKLINGDPLVTYEKFKDEFERFDLHSNTTIMTIPQFISQRLDELERDLTSERFVLVGMIGLFTLLSVQNVIIYFHRHAKKLVIRRLFGIRFLKAYAPVFWSLIITTFLFVFISIFIDGVAMLTVDSLIRRFLNEFFYIVSLLVIIEGIAMSIALFVIEKRNKLPVLQGE